MGIETLLNIASIASWDKRESIYSKLSKQEANTTLLFNKDKKPQA